MIKTNVNQRNQKISISFLIKTREGAKLKEILRNMLDKETLNFKIEENKTTLMFVLENMYVKVYCDKYLPGKLEINLYEDTNVEHYFILLILNYSKDFILEDPSNGIICFSNSRKITSKSNVNDVEINEKSDGQIMGFKNVYSYSVKKSLKSNNKVLIEYTYKNFIGLPKNTISIIDILTTTMFKQSIQTKEKVSKAIFKNNEEVKL